MMRKINKKVSTEKVIEGAKKFQGMFGLWQKNEGLITACLWLAGHVGKLRSEMDEIKKKIKKNQRRER